MNSSLICKICSSLVPKGRIYQHYRILHAADKLFPCPYVNCSMKVSNLNKFAIHLSRDHLTPDRKKNLIGTKAWYMCQMCSRLPSYCRTTKFWTIRQLILHLKNIHIRKNREIISCCFENCQFSTSVIGTWSSHFSRVHSDLDSSIRSSFISNRCLEAATQNETQEEDLLSDPVHSIPTENEYVADERVDIGNFEKSLACFFLKMQVIFHVPESAIQEIINNFIDLHKISVAELKRQLSTSSSTESYDLLTEFTSKYGSLSTAFRRNSFFTQRLPYVKPVELTASSPCGKIFKYVYVPILEDLTTLFQNSDILTKFKTKSVLSQYYEDFEDGSYFKKIPFPSDDQFHLKIFLYLDDWSAVNPLGMYARKRKLCAFNYALGNLPRKFRGCLQGIRLAALCPSSAIRACGISLIMKPILDDILTLEKEGLFIEKLDRKVFGTVVAVCADNLAAHSIGGFLESFGPNVNNFCRFCLATASSFHDDDMDIDQFEWRTIKNYREHISQIGVDRTVTSVHGLKFDSPLNCLNSVHVTSLLPPDPTHDLGEGVIPYEMNLALRHFIHVKQYFSYEFLQLKLRNFPFGLNDRPNISDFLPIDFMKRDNIGGNATKNLYLLRFLPLLVSDMVPPGDSAWRCIILLKRIVEFIFCEKFKFEHTIMLDLLIRQHRLLFREAFPNKNLKPKHHFMEHYPALMRCFGPLVHFQTMRFESKHAFFKRIIHQTMNFKNICLLLAKRHQLWQTYHMTSSSFFKDEIIVTTSEFRHIHSFSEPQAILFSRRFPQLDQVPVSYEISICGQMYRKNMFLTHQFISGHPCFCQIDFIFILDEKVYFMCNHYESFYCEDTACYDLSSSKEAHILDLNSLSSFYPLHAYHVNGDLRITLKFRVFE